MDLLIGKKNRVYFYIFIFLLLTTISNLNISEKNKGIMKINEIEVIGLNSNLNFIINKKLNYLINKNIFFFNKDHIEEVLNKFTFIESYFVKKIFPSKILVSLKQTDFIAKTIKQNNYYIVGSNGKLFSDELFEIDKELPTVFGDFNERNLIKLIKIIDSVNLQNMEFKYIYSFPSGRWDLKTSNDLLIRLPSEDLLISLTNVKKIINSNENNIFKTIDLRVPNQIILN